MTEFDAKKGNITWVNRNWYQAHKLKNIESDFCATIQCYSYAQDDPIHWPFFDYVKDGSYRNQFVPDSDFTFVEMRDAVMKEYREAMADTRRRTARTARATGGATGRGALVAAAPKRGTKRSGDTSQKAPAAKRGGAKKKAF